MSNEVIKTELKKGDHVYIPEIMAENRRHMPALYVVDFVDNGIVSMHPYYNNNRMRRMRADEDGSKFYSSF